MRPYTSWQPPVVIPAAVGRLPETAEEPPPLPEAAQPWSTRRAKNPMAKIFTVDLLNF
jgi:hypothetical protein